MLVRNPQDVLDARLLNVLFKNFGFDDRGIRSNLKLFVELKEKGVDVLDFLLGIEDKAKQAYSPQGYAIKSLQNLLNGSNSHLKRRSVSLLPSVKPITESEASSERENLSPVRRKGRTGGRLDVKSAEEFGNSGLEEI